MRTHKFMAVWRRPPRVVAVIATCALVAAGIVLPSSSAFAAAGCSVQYSKAWDNGSGFGANVAITNTGDPITNGWTLEFDFPGNQRITDLWPVAFTQPAGSAHVTISSNADWNKAIATGATFTPGFNGNYSGANANPTSFKLNGDDLRRRGTDPGRLADERERARGRHGRRTRYGCPSRRPPT